MNNGVCTVWKKNGIKLQVSGNEAAVSPHKTLTPQPLTQSVQVQALKWVLRQWVKVTRHYASRSTTWIVASSGLSLMISTNCTLQVTVSPVSAEASSS